MRDTNNQNQPTTSEAFVWHTIIGQISIQIIVFIMKH